MAAEGEGLEEEDEYAHGRQTGGGQSGGDDDDHDEDDCLGRRQRT